MKNVIIGTAVFTLVIFAWFTTTEKKRPNPKPLPPGPPRLPLIGNIHQAPKKWPWRTYTEWAKIYGPIMNLQFGRKTIIILSSHQTSRDLLDKRGNIYSGRPHLTMGGDCVSKGYRSLLMQYGQKYRLYRRTQGSFLSLKKSAEYRSLQDLESRQMMFDLLGADHNTWRNHFHRFSASLIYSLAYGKRMTYGTEKEIVEIEQVANNFLYAARVGTWIVDAIPLLNMLPKFLAPWKQIGDQYHQLESTVFMRNLDGALKMAGSNWAKEAVTMKESRELPVKELAYLVGILYQAGTDTTNQSLQSFVLSALSYADEYRKAQAELDKAVGDEIPTYDHRPKLAYIEAVVKEVLRWRPVSAGGIPHAANEDDEYMGYRIPRGATVVGNHWAIDRDTDVYGLDVEVYRPSRWIEDPDLPLASFGYGRRVCIGQTVAMNSLIIVIARLLWTFDIGHAHDSDGKRIEVDDLAFTQGFNSGPEPFAARFVVRSEKKKLAIKAAWADVKLS